MDTANQSKPESKPQPTIESMLKRLDEMYDREEAILKEMDTLGIEYQQLQEDKELLQMMIMHQSNKRAKFEHYRKVTGRQ